MHAGVTELRNTRNAAQKRHLANAPQTTSGGRGRRHLANAYETSSGRVITARVTRRGAAGAGGRVITASYVINPFGCLGLQVHSLPEMAGAALICCMLITKTVQ